MTRVALVGTGVVGGSWALVFARAGLEVAIHDADAAAAGRVIDFARTALADLAAQGIAAKEPADAVLARLSVAPSLERALETADHVQESVPERVEIKRALYRTLDAVAPAATVLASSTSGLPASAFTEGLAGRARCVVAHPINPPHLVPLVEIVPAPWTAPETVERTTALMRAIGQSPIRLRREINGFVVNRLQSALLAEAFRLVEDGVVDADEVDRAMTDGLGLRWFFLGPFQTIDLNAKDGVAEYCRNLGPMYYDLAREQADAREWNAALVARVESELRRTVPADALPARRSWRDRVLATLGTVKQRIAQEAGG
ncbi:MAG: 3-hydroxyacyl-CoA dehydrogenase [Proteobacteria bacterium]|nr:3-hydroxyacyl-CoA dehydrogenase [Pseudomonadota bacterium]